MTKEEIVTKLMESPVAYQKELAENMAEALLAGENLLVTPAGYDGSPDRPLVNVVVMCRSCGEVYVIQDISYEGYKDWKYGALIQRALPGLTADQRELLISQTCPVCWEKLFGEDKDAEPETPAQEPRRKYKYTVLVETDSAHLLDQVQNAVGHVCASMKNREDIRVTTAGSYNDLKEYLEAKHETDDEQTQA